MKYFNISTHLFIYGVEKLNYLSIFPSANSFVKGKMLGAGWYPTGPDWGEFRHLWAVLGGVIIYTQLEYM